MSHCNVTNCDIFFCEYNIHNKEIKNITKKQITYNVTLMINVQQGIKNKINIYLKTFWTTKRLENVK